MTSIVICEKKNQADDLRKALGKRFGEILPASGHILTLKEPEEKRTEWSTWSAGLLWPGKFYEKKPSESNRRLLDAIRNAARGADTVIIATDCDREGQLIGDEILEYVGFRGKVMRAMFTAQDPKSLQEAFAKLEPNSKYRGLYMAGQAREQADQTANLSLTRTATVTLKAPGSKGAIGIGRVKTPVLGIVCKRELEITDFKPENMFEIDADAKVAAGVLTLCCSKMPASLIKEQSAAEGIEEDEEEELGSDEEALAEKGSTRGRILDQRIADAVKAAAKVHAGPIRMKAERKKMGPPKLLDLTALQSACSSRFGWTGAKTLEMAQYLYDIPKITTYPRGESRHVPVNMIPDVAVIVPALLGLANLRPHAALLEKPIVRRGKSGHFHDTGAAHHAIIPNVNVADQFATLVPRLPEDARKCWDVIVRHYLAALAPDHEYRQTTVTMDVPFRGHAFDLRASGRVPLIPGWKAILGGAGATVDKDEEPEFCAVQDGETARVIDARTRTVTTRPPARYSEGALLKVMKEAWRLVDEPKMRARLKEADGIGTAATRGNVIEGLVKQGQIALKGKTLQPTEGGMLLYKTLMGVCPNVVDPARTAVWETLFDRVQQGAMTAEDAVAKILAETSREIERIVSNGSTARISIGTKSKPTPKMADLARSVSDRTGIALPKGALTDGNICRAYLDANLPKREPGAGGAGGFPPSEKQMAFAEGSRRKPPRPSRRSLSHPQGS